MTIDGRTLGDYLPAQRGKDQRFTGSSKTPRDDRPELSVRRQDRTGGNDGVDAYTIPEFCRRHGISPSFYFILQQQSLTPAVMKVGARRLISKEAAAAWRAQRETAE
jgi:hypothetical protein